MLDGVALLNVDHIEDAAADVAQPQKTDESSNVESEEKSSDAQNLLLNGLLKDNSTLIDETVKVNLDLDECNERTVAPVLQNVEIISCSNDPVVAQDKPKTVYRVDAEEFVPRALRDPPRLPLLNMTNFVPMPVPQFLPSHIPIGIFPAPDPKLLSGFVNFLPGQPPFAPPEPLAPAPPETAKPDIDIAKIVSKLEEAALEQNKPAVQPKTAAATPTAAVAANLSKNLHDNNNKFKSRSYDRNYRRAEAPRALAKQNSVEAKVQNDVAPQKASVAATNVNTPPAASSPARSVPDYSETLKRNKTAAARGERAFHATGKPNWRQLSSPKAELSVEVPRTPEAACKNSKPVDRWISVQSRKKRKNGKTENDESEFDQVAEEDGCKEFEDYDVNLLVDVVVPKKEGIETKPTNVEKKTDVPEVKARESVETVMPLVEKEEDSEEKPKKPDEKVQISDQKVQNLPEKVQSLPEKVQNPPEEAVEETAIVVPTLKTLATTSLKGEATEKPKFESVVNTSSPVETKTIEETAAENETLIETIAASSALEVTEDSKNKYSSAKGTNRKKQKKGVTPKPVQKRIMITDIDLSATVEAKPMIEKQPERIEKVEKAEKIEKVEKIVAAPADSNKPADKPAEKVIEIAPKEAAVCEAIEAKPEEPKTPDKKAKKKKKKSKSAAKEPQQSLSSSLLTLNGVEDVSCDFLDKTYEEIDSKTNVEVSQEIDRMIQRGLYANLEEKMKSLNLAHSPLDDTFFKSIANDAATFNLLKSPKETKINGPLLGSVPQMNGNLNGLMNSKKINLDMKKIAAPTQMGVVKSEQKTATTKKNAKEAVLSETSDKVADKRSSTAGDSLVTYPITQAVKEWMTKTRENTPELEILKSPSEIMQEFCVPDVDDSVSEPGKEDIVVFSADVDLLDCWENEISAEASPKSGTSEGGSTSLLNGEAAAGKIEQGEDVLEVYESVYGKNSDYLKLKAEVENEAAQRTRFAKHGDLPYRAICCSVM